MRILLLAALAALCGCETVKPYQKEFLLNPVMDDAVAARLSPSLMTSASASFEKLSSAGAGGGGGSSCPTCGG